MNARRRLNNPTVKRLHNGTYLHRVVVFGPTRDQSRENTTTGGWSRNHARSKSMSSSTGCSPQLRMPCTGWRGFPPPTQGNSSPKETASAIRRGSVGAGTSKPDTHTSKVPTRFSAPGPKCSQAIRKRRARPGSRQSRGTTDERWRPLSARSTGRSLDTRTPQLVLSLDLLQCTLLLPPIECVPTIWHHAYLTLHIILRRELESGPSLLDQI